MTEYNAYFDEIYLIYEGNYKDGEKNGEGIEYSPKGNPQFEGMYKSFAVHLKTVYKRTANITA